MGHRGHRKQSPRERSVVVGKKITNAQMIGQKGVNLIERVVLDMGFTWAPTGNLETGIDGYIEIRDSTTGEMTNFVLQVQSKATEAPFTAETEDGFEYLCEDRDIDYWMQGNAPVILVRSRPSTDEAYWISVKDYFKDPAIRKTRKIRFDKRRDRFCPECKTALVGLAAPADSGFYLAPPPVSEMLYSNLLPVTHLAKRIYMAETPFRLAKALWTELRRLGGDIGAEWLLKGGQILSFRDLTEFPWREICNQGTVEDFTTDEWSQSADRDKRNELLWLMYRALDEKTDTDLRYDKEKEYWYFKATRHLGPRKIYYQSHSTRASSTVFQAYPSKKDPNKISYCRHAAFAGQFVQYDGDWYLEITPTFHFTQNGRDISLFYEDLLSGIKRLQRNLNILGQLRMWADYLNKPGDMITPEYPYLIFGPLATFQLDAGVDDKHWLDREDEDERENASSADLDAPQLALFDL